MIMIYSLQLKTIIPKMAEVYTLYENVTRNFDEGKKILMMRWDVSDETVNNLMFQELGACYDKNTFTNLSIITEFKEHIQWKQGDTIQLNISSTLTDMFRGETHIEIIENAYQELYTFLEINGDGYLYLKEFCGDCICHRCETEFTSHKINCYYNDLVQEERDSPYILK
jgi:hypothetical protein